MTAAATAREHAAALLALLNGPLGELDTPRQAYDMDLAPKKGGDFVAITLSRRIGGVARVGGPLSPSAWRLTTRAVGVGVSNARVLLDVCTTALEWQTVTVDDVTSTPIAFEAEDPIRQDEDDKNLWSGLRSWTFAY